MWGRLPRRSGRELERVSEPPSPLSSASIWWVAVEPAESSGPSGRGHQGGGSPWGGSQLACGLGFKSLSPLVTTQNKGGILLHTGIAGTFQKVGVEGCVPWAPGAGAGWGTWPTGYGVLALGARLGSGRDPDSRPESPLAPSPFSEPSSPGAWFPQAQAGAQPTLWLSSQNTRLIKSHPSHSVLRSHLCV